MKTVELTKQKLITINGGQGGRTLHKPGAITLDDIYSLFDRGCGGTYDW